MHLSVVCISSVLVLIILSAEFLCTTSAEMLDWPTNPRISFCKSARLRKTEDDCEKDGLEFDARRCKCIGTATKPDSTARPMTAPRGRPQMEEWDGGRGDRGPWDRGGDAVRGPPVESYSAGTQRCLVNAQERTLDLQSFLGYLDDDGKNSAPVFMCGLQLGAIYVPRPTQAHLSRDPPALLGPVCANFVDNVTGTRCVAKKKFKRLFEVSLLDESQINIDLEPIDETIEIAMDESCHFATNNYPLPVAEAVRDILMPCVTEPSTTTTKTTVPVSKPPASPAYLHGRAITYEIIKDMHLRKRWRKKVQCSCEFAENYKRQCNDDAAKFYDCGKVTHGCSCYLAMKYWQGTCGTGKRFNTYVCDLE